MSRRKNILPTRASFFFSSSGKFERVQETKTKFFELLFNANDSYIATICLYSVAFNVHAILYV